MKALSKTAVAALLVATQLSGCAGSDKDEPAEAPPAPLGWRQIATAADRDRVARWRTAWTTAIAKAQASGHGDRVAGQGVLLQPDAALDNPEPPPGEYSCRVTKLGSQSESGLDYISYPGFTCRITREGDMLSLAKINGSQRPVGLLFPDEGGRMIFLGSMVLGDEARALDYGRDPERDTVGIVERIGPGRWRLVMPFPRWESTLDVMELTPKR